MISGCSNGIGSAVSKLFKMEGWITIGLDIEECRSECVDSMYCGSVEDHDIHMAIRKDLMGGVGRLDCIELSEKNKKMVYIPRGFAHGFCTLTNHCDVLYKVDNYYNQEAEGGINWHDETLAIEWPIDNPIVSEKDNCLPSYNDFVEKYGSIDLNKKYL